MTDELEVLAPSGASASLRGEAFELKPLTIGKIPKIVRVARPVIEALSAHIGKESEAENDEDVLSILLDLVGDHGEAIFKAVGIAIDRDPDWIEGSDPDDFIAFAVALVRVNVDFFARVLAPLLANLSAAKSSSGDGQTPSNS